MNRDVGETKVALPPETTCDVSVVIVSYNTRDITLRCVETVLASENVTIEVIVVDNCSSDGSAEALRAAFPGVAVIDSPRNGGFAFGNNIGFDRARGRYVLVLNPDTEVNGDTIARAVAYCDAHRDVGVLGCRVRYEDGTPQSTIIRYLSLTQLFGIVFVPSRILRRTPLFGDLRYAGLSRDAIHDVDAVAGCFMLVPRTVLEQVGGLDQRFFMYGEENEWCRRITRAGWIVRYNPEMEVMHLGAASTAHMSVWKAVEITRGHVLFLRFTRGPVIAWIGTLLMLLRDLRSAPWHLLRAMVRRTPDDAADRKAWRTRLGFLLKALVDQPKGQTISRRCGA